MTAAFVVADVHLANFKQYGGETKAGLNERALQVLGTLEAAWRLARPSHTFVVAGDLFDSDRPTPQLIAAAMGEDVADNRVFILGNHDATSSRVGGDNAFAPFRSQAGNTVVDAEPRTVAVGSYRDRFDMLCVPFGFRVTELVDFERSSAPLVVVFHAGIKDSSTPSYLRTSEEAIDVDELTAWMKEHDVCAAVAGDWHTHRAWPARNIFQVGALCPTGWQNPGIVEYGSVLKLTRDNETVRVERLVVPGPRFITVPNEDELRATIESVDYSHHARKLYVRASFPPSKTVWPENVHIEHQDEVETKQDRVTATADSIREAATLVEAVEQYAQKEVRDEAKRLHLVREITRRLGL